MAQLGEWIKAGRKAAGLTQHKLAEKVGAAPWEISYIERGIRNPNGELDAITEALGLEMAEAPQYRAPRKKQPKPTKAGGKKRTAAESQTREIYMGMLRDALDINDEDLALDLMIKIIDAS